MAEHWGFFQSPADRSVKVDDGNDRSTQCLLSVVDDLVERNDRQTVLDLGTGSGITARRFAKQGAHVIGLEYLNQMPETIRQRSEMEKLKGSVTMSCLRLDAGCWAHAGLKGRAF